MTEEKQLLNLGGNVESAISGQYSLDIKRILSEAWSYTSQNRLSIVLGVVFSIFISMLAIMVLTSFMGDIETLIKDNQSMMVINLVVTVVSAPFIAGVEMMGIYHAIGIKTKPNMVFSFLSRASWVALASLLTLTITNLGFAILFIPGVVLLIAFSPVSQLVVEKQMTPFQAISTCLKTFFRKQWFQLFVTYLFVFGCAVACMIPMVLLQSMPAVGLAVSLVLFTFLIPFYYNVKGIIYREVFGVFVDQNTSSNAVVSQDNNTFDA